MAQTNPSLRLSAFAGAAAAALLLVSCGVVDPNRPTPQADTNVFGGLLDVAPAADRPGAFLARIRVYPPRELTRAEQEVGRPTPTIEESVIAEVTVDPDTVVLVDGRAGSLEGLTPGTEVAVLPAAGSMRMIGTTRVLLDASFFMDFSTYHRWQLPALGTPPEEPEADPAHVNSPGVEHAPVPLSGGRVLYFAAHLRPPWKPGGPFVGARRPGMPEPREGTPPVERTYRTELGKDGWAPPEPVALPGVEKAAVVRISWVNEGETVCLVTVGDPGGGSWVGRAERSRNDRPWGPVQRIPGVEGEAAADAVYLAGSSTMVAFSRSVTVGNSDLYMLNPKQMAEAKPLDPRINTPGPEWCPRVGPTNQLFFCRGQRQLIYAQGIVDALRVPGSFRKVLTEANPRRQVAVLCHAPLHAGRAGSGPVRGRMEGRWHPGRSGAGG